MAVVGVLDVLVVFPFHKRPRVVAQFVVELHARAGAGADVDEILDGQLVGVGGTRLGGERQDLVRLRTHVDDRAVRAVGEVHGDAEPAAENLGVGQRDIRPRLIAVVGGAPDRAEGAVDAPAGRTVERTLGNQIHRATNRVAVHVRRRRFRDLDAFDGIGADRLKLKFARSASRRRVGDPVPILRDRAEVLIETADAQVAVVSADRLALDARQPHHEVRGIAGETTEGVGRHDALHAAGQPLERDGLGVALAFARDHKALQFVDVRGEADIAPRRRRGGNHHRHIRDGKARVGHGDDRGARRGVFKTIDALTVARRFEARAF